MSKIQIFSEATEIGKTGKKLTCYLVEMSLKDYIDNLPTDYNDYDIQRGIVNNIYLDSLGTDLLRGKHFPIITLISESVNKSTEEIKDFKILDGLQRTYRLSQLYKGTSNNTNRASRASNLSLIYSLFLVNFCL